MSGLGRIFMSLVRFIRGIGRWLARLPLWGKVAVVAAIVLALIGLNALLGGPSAREAASYERAVTLASVASLSGGGSGGSVLGTVRSVTEAELLAQTGGTVRRVNARVGSSVGAGSVIAELENASERAAVLQAEGSYDAAVAANAVSATDVTTDVRSTYGSAFAEIDTTVELQIDSFFGSPTATGPDLLIHAGGTESTWLSQTRTEIRDEMNEWRGNLEETDTRTPSALLSEMESVLSLLSTFLTELADAANSRDSGASETQLANLAAARTTIANLSTEVAALRNTYNAQQAGGRPSGVSSATEAAVKQALGSLRLAEAALEKTVIRAPISGTVNFLPIRVGDYVTSFTHVATVAQNGALEIVAYVSEDERAALSVGQRVTVDGTRTGVITMISPALDPVTKQIEIRVAVEGATDDELVNGQSARIELPALVTSASTTEGPLMLPLSAVKLYADTRIVFTVNEEGRLVGTSVETGDVRGDRIEILSSLSPDLRIVTDARGLAEGEKVRIAP